jgi:Hemerythrin HHE cation binding domain
MRGKSEATPHGAIWRLLANDHARLDLLLQRVGSCRSAEDIAAYDQFRRGLLRHIAMEEKVLLPAAERARGAPIPEALRLG